MGSIERDALRVTRSPDRHAKCERAFIESIQKLNPVCESTREIPSDLSSTVMDRLFAEVLVPWLIIKIVGISWKK